MPRRIDGGVERGARALAQRTTRRSFLGAAARGFVALVGGPFVAVALAPDRAQAHHICGHTFTTGSCPHPYRPYSRVDRYGYPLHPTKGYPVDDFGKPYTSRSRARRKVCQQRVPDEYPFVRRTEYGGGWSRCCNGRIRRIRDCCSPSTIRINGDGSVRGYCHHNLRVFCITYRELNVRC